MDFILNIFKKDNCKSKAQLSINDFKHEIALVFQVN
jgi:hypothetical protein